MHRRSATVVPGIPAATLLAALLFGVGCNGCQQSTNAEDSGASSPTDAGTDAGMTLRADAGNDAGIDAGPIVDAGVDSGSSSGDAGAGCIQAWTENPNDPVIQYGQGIPNTFWNDPSVIKDGSTYRMWLSGGNPNTNPIVVNVYEATSADGAQWTIGATPELSPDSNAAAWDGLRIETPSVIKVGATYHMYYAGCNSTTCTTTSAVYEIGHATSPDGVTWTKDAANPVVVHQPTSSQWGYYTATEPGVVYVSSKNQFNLYYVGMMTDSVDPTIVHIGILLATSSDGTNFSYYTGSTSQRQVILTHNIAGATSGSWFGYTEPMAFIDSNGVFQLYYALIVAPVGPTSARTVTIQHALSSDGINFVEDPGSIFQTGHGNWFDQDVRSPTVLQDGSALKMWFAGDTQTPTFGASIGYATSPCP
jgi:hypothetical protein